MLSLLIAHIIITIASLWSGFLFYKLFQRSSVEPKSLIFYLISGLIMLTGFVQIVVLIFPIGLYIQLIVGAILLLLLLLRWEDFKRLHKRILAEFSPWPGLSVVLFLLSWLIVLLMNSGPVIMDDSESYHIQSIKWIQEYGSVPGLVNLHERFGFNSSWFSTAALFSFSNETSGGFTVLNGVLSLWLCYWCISKYNQLQKENNLQSALSVLLILVIGLIIWPLIRGNASTTNYDFITTVVILILFIEIFLSKEFSPSIDWIIWPAYLCTVRIINFPLLLLGVMAFIYFIRQRNLKSLLLPVAYCLLLIAPFIIRNIIISGYPFYPATGFDVTNVDWKPDPVITERLLEYIKYYNRVSTTYLDIEQTKALGAAWVSSWFSYLFVFDKVLLILGSAGFLITIAKLFIQKNKKATLLIAISLIWIICWLLISPDPRFVYGVLLFGIFLFVYNTISLLKNATLLKLIPGVLIMVMIVSASFYFISKLWKQKEYRNWILPARLPQPPVKEVMIDQIIFRIPEMINNNWNARCYGTELPCLYRIDSRLRPRGKEIRRGFHLEK